MKKHRGKIILFILAMLGIVVFGKFGRHGQWGELFGSMGEPPMTEEHSE